MMWHESTFSMTSIFLLQVVREFYSQARKDIELPLEFSEGKCISLAIPRRGVILQSGWKIISRYNPIVSYNCYLLLMCIYREVVIHCSCHFEQIQKAYVDHFNSGQMIPKCELLLRWPHKDKPHVCLEHDIEITGAKGCSYFTLYVPDAGERCQVVYMNSFLSFICS